MDMLGAGKGSFQRPGDRNAFANNYDLIFRKKKVEKPECHHPQCDCKEPGECQKPTTTGDSREAKS
jgi:hypothetical protein